MVQVHDIYPPSGAYLRANTDITDDTEVVITGYEIRSFQDSGNKAILSFAGLEKSLRLNVTNARKIEAAYGGEMDNWIGKKIVLYPDMVKSPQGGMVPSVCVRVPKSLHTTAQLQAPLRPGKFDELNPPTADDESGF